MPYRSDEARRLVTGAMAEARKISGDTSLPLEIAGGANDCASALESFALDRDVSRQDLANFARARARSSEKSDHTPATDAHRRGAELIAEFLERDGRSAYPKP